MDAKELRMFQFLRGAIGSLLTFNQLNSWVLCFNSLEVRLVAVYVVVILYLEALFQFLRGAIGRVNH